MQQNISTNLESNKLMDNNLLEKHKNDPAWAEVMRLYSGLFDTQDERENFILDLAEADILLAAECKTSSVIDERKLQKSLFSLVSSDDNSQTTGDRLLASLEIGEVEFAYNLLKLHRGRINNATLSFVIQRANPDTIALFIKNFIMVIKNVSNKISSIEKVNTIIHSLNDFQINDSIILDEVSHFLKFLLKEGYYSFVSAIVTKHNLSLQTFYNGSIDMAVNTFTNRAKGSIQRMKRIKFAIFIVDFYSYNDRIGIYKRIVKLIDSSLLNKGKYRNKYKNLKSDLEKKINYNEEA